MAAHTSDKEKTNQLNSDTLALSTIVQAAFVLRCFEKGITSRELLQHLQGEESLTRAYLIYFKQMKWIEGEEEGVWTITDVGRETLAALSGSPSPPPRLPNQNDRKIVTWHNMAKKLKLTQSLFSL